MITLLVKTLLFSQRAVWVAVTIVAVTIIVVFNFDERAVINLNTQNGRDGNALFVELVLYLLHYVSGYSGGLPWPMRQKNGLFNICHPSWTIVITYLPRIWPKLMLSRTVSINQITSCNHPVNKWNRIYLYNHRWFPFSSGVFILIFIVNPSGFVWTRSTFLSLKCSPEVCKQF